MEGHLACD